MYRFVEPMHVRPLGWMKRQLEIQNAGLNGNLDKMWPDVRDSAWIGGDREGWERVPYWLDGFLPLAYMLEDKDAIARAERYVKAILDGQQEDGWICPCDKEGRAKYDPWGVILIGKVLACYCELTHSKRAEKALYRAMRNFYDLMVAGEVKLFNWGAYRWYECFIPLQYLYERYKEEWMLEHAKLLREQGINYWDYINTWERPLDKWTLYTHIVNLVMMLKYEAVSCKLLGGKYKNDADKLWKILEKYNGTAVGSFTGDECLSGIGNNRGPELCSIAELMYSCELLYAITGDKIWADRLEKLAFNALPATISEDMWTHQYLQMVNQIACVRFPGRSFFRTNGPGSHMFGLEPHFGCCTANFGQAWPKLIESLFIKDEDGIRLTSMLPAEAVTVTAVPFRGCRLKELYCESGADLRPLFGADGYSFYMPDRNETVHAVFEKVVAYNVPPTDPDGQLYVLDLNDMCFHYPDCVEIEQIAPWNYYECTCLRESLIDRDYHPCNTCQS